MGEGRLHAQPGLLGRLDVEGGRRPAGEHTVALVVDDGTQVCAAYERAGFAVLRADWMPAQDVLDSVQEREGST
ncbi:HAD family hydrolase [Streptomyces reniochalinae]|uniref:hypothetical protein n=1 Tax=Streptomyces reniochalinae TaxID=2250578 RepID=UPI0015F04286|nr:hypothetical protein [Streptomyces reniochalinae]